MVVFIFSVDCCITWKMGSGALMPPVGHQWNRWDFFICSVQYIFEKSIRNVSRWTRCCETTTSSLTGCLLWTTSSVKLCRQPSPSWCQVASWGSLTEHLKASLFLELWFLFTIQCINGLKMWWTINEQKSSLCPNTAHIRRKTTIMVAGYFSLSEQCCVGWKVHWGNTFLSLLTVVMGKK